MAYIARFGMAIVLVGLLATITACNAAKTPESSKVSVGDPAPDWKNIQGIDEASHSLADYRDAKAIVLVFTCNHCPVAKAYESRLVALEKDYQGKGVQLIAVNVNDIPEDRLDKMQERAKEAGFRFPYLFDPTQKIGRDYGATCTPHFFLLDANRTIVYTGAMDNNMDAEKVTKQYLRDAIDAVLDGRDPPEPITQQKGCSIKWK